MAYNNMNILVVDDEKEIADLIGIYLQNEGYNVITCGRAAGVMDIVERENISLAILDVMLPDGDGMELLREIRREHYFPVIMLTAKIRDTDKITGLTLGADDYITKPFNPLELMARVKTQLRGLTIDRDTHKARLNGSELVLTPMEFSILRYLCEHRGKVVSSEELYEKVWGEEFLDCNNTVMAHIARLRSKMKEPARHPRYIKTVWGVGYTIE